MLENKSNRTELSDLGEFGLIDHLKQAVEVLNPNTIKGIGDDAAILSFDGFKTVVSTDMLVEGVHFDLSYVPLKHLGYKAVVVNLSDIYAMNANPTQITVSVAISNRFSLEAIEELYSGILMACKNYNVDLVGGDTTSSLSGLIISVTALGQVKEEKVVYRNGAQLNDLICVTGDLGAAYVGLQILEREKQIFLETPGVQPDLEGKDYILERQLKPEVRKEVIELMASKGIKPTSMMDISDGLSSELLHLCTASDLGCTIYEDKLPIDPQTYQVARDINLDPSVCALNGGEDYELIFTVPLADYEKISSEMDVSIIGHMTDKASGYFLVDKSENMVPLVAQGWNALLSKD